jgi:hypothetical protein
MAAMSLRMIAFACVVRNVQAADIEPDWKKLTDFSTSVTFDLAPLLDFEKEVQSKMAARCRDDQGCSFDGKCYCKQRPDVGPYSADCSCPGPWSSVKSDSGSGTIQLDVLGERFKMTSDEHADFSHASSLPAPLQGAKVSGAASIAFDAKAGFVVYKGKAVIASSAVGPGSFEFCAKVNFPQGLLPPGQAIMAQLEQVKPQVESALRSFPHQDAVVDGIDVSVYEQQGIGGLAPNRFAAIQHDATPVGLGIQGPVGGKWDSAIMKFYGWTTGAGTIEEESCVTMSATELLQSHHANRTLWVFDQFMSQLKTTEALSAALAFIPSKPSQIFASAAGLESITVSASVVISSPSAWFTMAMAAVGGVVGAGFMLVLSKSSRASARGYALLA